MRRALRRIAMLACLALLGGAAYWYLGAGQPSQPQQKQGQQKGFRRGGGNPNDTVPVLAIPARLADVPVYLDGVGTAKALNTVTVRSQVDGKLMKIAFKEGQEVTQGSIIAKIDPTIYQAQYDVAVAKKAQDEALLANAKLDLERYVRLAASNAINKQQADTQRALVDQLSAQIRSDQAAIDNAKAVLDYTNIVAPISGRTGIRQVDEGNIVHAADATGLVTITQIKPISVFFSLPQQNLPQLNRGQAQGPLPVQALGSDGKSVLDNGKLTVIDNQVDQTTGTVRLRAEFPNAQVQLWPGQFVNVRLLIDTLHQVVTVPTAAVQRGPNGTFVYVLKDEETASMRPVEVRQQDEDRAVIAKGVQAQERVITTSFARISDGALVQAPSASETAGQPGTTSGQEVPDGQTNAPRRKGGRNRGSNPPSAPP
jgi:multidrug efflux system membrane fusion protein